MQSSSSACAGICICPAYVEGVLNGMDDREKNVWIDEERMLLAFHPFENGKIITKSETLFWSFILSLMKSGYRVM